MFKELIISIIIIIVIFSLDLFTQNYTEKSVDKITKQFSELKTYISENNTEKIQQIIKNINNDWERMHDKLAYYIEHDELEKVDTAITVMKSYIETEEFSLAIAELEEGKFVLEHIQEKNSFNLENIF